MAEPRFVSAHHLEIYTWWRWLSWERSLLCSQDIHSTDDDFCTGCGCANG